MIGGQFGKLRVNPEPSRKIEGGGLVVDLSKNSSQRRIFRNTCLPAGRNQNPEQSGRLAEWTNAPHLKCGKLATASEVRILHLPPVRK